MASENHINLICVAIKYIKLTYKLPISQLSMIRGLGVGILSPGGAIIEVEVRVHSHQPLISLTGTHCVTQTYDGYLQVSNILNPTSMQLYSNRPIQPGRLYSENGLKIAAAM